MSEWPTIKELQEHHGDNIKELLYDKNYVYVIPKGEDAEIKNSPYLSKLESLVYNRFNTKLAFVKGRKYPLELNPSIATIGVSDDFGRYDVKDYIDGTPVYISKLDNKTLIATGAYGDTKTPEKAIKFLKRNHSMYKQLLDIMALTDTYTFMAVGPGYSKVMPFDRFNLVMICLMDKTIAEPIFVNKELFETGTLIPVVSPGRLTLGEIVSFLKHTQGTKGLTVTNKHKETYKVYTQWYLDELAKKN